MTAPKDDDAPGRLTAEMVGNMFDKLWQAGWSARAELAEPLTDAELDRFRAEWERKRHGPPRLLTPLPRRVRLRLALTGAVDRVAIWLCDHRMWRAAGLLWWRR